MLAWAAGQWQWVTVVVVPLPQRGTLPRLGWSELPGHRLRRWGN